MNVARILTAITLASIASGCAMLRSDWTDGARAEKTPVAGVAPKAEAGSALLDVAFISIVVDPESIKQPTAIIESDTQLKPETEIARSDVDELWRWIDETAISPEVRAKLKLNGLRVGRVHTQSEFNRALDLVRRTPSDDTARFLASAAVGSDISQASRRIPCRLGRRYELPVRQPAAGEVATLVSLGGRTIGKTLDGPQPLFAVTVQPENASSVHIRMQPEIQYGAMRQTWVSSDSAIRIDSRRDSWVMEELAFEMTAAAGGTIVAGAIMPPFGLGEQMFTGKTADGETDHVVVVLRVAELPNMISK